MRRDTGVACDSAQRAWLQQPDSQRPPALGFFCRRTRDAVLAADLTAERIAR